MSVASILQALAENAGQAQLRKGAIYGNLARGVAQVPAQIIDDREKDALRARSQAMQDEQLGFQRSADTRATSDQAMQEKTAALAEQRKAAVSAGLSAAMGESGDPAKFDAKAAFKAVSDLGQPDAIRDVIAAHQAMQPKLLEHDPTKALLDPANPAGAPVVPAVPKPDPVTTASLDARQQFLLSKRAQKVALTPAEEAEVSAYEDRKRTVSDPAQTAAAERQATAITASNEHAAAAVGAQAAQQKRAQDFTALQAARADLEKNVNTPYNTAKTSANTLRDVVEAAKNGNTVAGSLQSLETTMAAIRAQGLNRINTAEIGATGNAGSLWNNIEGWVGKKAEGQPVPPAVQKDMLEFASILEKAAYKKYQAGHAATNKLYGTSIPELLTGPDAAAAPAPDAPKRIRYDINGKIIP